MIEKRLSEIEEWLWSIWNNRDITEEEFKSISNELNKLKSKENEARCDWILSEMYTVKYLWAMKSVTEISKRGMSLDDSYSGFLDSFSTSQNGKRIDFKKRNHNNIIKYYINYINEKPNNYFARQILIHNLIDNYRFDEALKEIDTAYSCAGERGYILDFLKGEILYRKGLTKEAELLWEETIKKYSNDYVCYFEYAEQLAQFARYEEAIKVYRVSFDMQAKPRRIDSLQTIVLLYDILDNPGKMLEVLEEIIKVYEDDYQMIDGEAADFYRQRDEVLKRMNS